MRTTAVTLAAVVLSVGLTNLASADVLNMGGTRDPATGQWNGLASLETVPVGNTDNPGELSGTSAGGYGPDQVCGSVSYTYNIGKYEVTAGQYCEFLNAVATTDTYALYNPQMWFDVRGCKIQRSGSSGSYTYNVALDYANRPVDYVSFGDACRFANWLHNGEPTGPQNLTTTEDGAYYLNGATSESALLAVTRKANCKWAVTSEDEWYKAAYHKNDGAAGNYYHYPTSSNLVPGRDLNDASGNNANYPGDPIPIQAPYYKTVVGEFQNSPSPYGTFDQGGNLWEWNEAVLSDLFRGLRGGSFYTPYEGYTNMLSSVRDNYFASYEGNWIGFRVVRLGLPAVPANPGPSSGQIDLLVSTALSWSGAATDVTFDVYLDVVNPPRGKIASGISTTSLTPSLTGGSRYYWKVVAINADGQTEGPVWTFATHLTGDLNGDGYINVGDLQLLIQNWGRSVF